MNVVMTGADKLNAAHFLDPDFPPRGSIRSGTKNSPPPNGRILGSWVRLGIGSPAKYCSASGRVVFWATRTRKSSAAWRRPASDDHCRIAGGQSRTVMIPNLLRYPGSVVVIDPKGELARETAIARAERFGQNVVVLDPFGASGFQSYAYNPLDELDPASDTFIDDIALAASSLIIGAKGDNAHWTDSAKSLVAGVLLYMYAVGGECSLPRLRRILMGEDGPLTFGEDDGSSLFERMAAIDAFDGRVARIGSSFRDKSEREGASIVSTAREQLAFWIAPMADVLRSSPPAWAHQGRTDHDLSVPARRPAGQHARWLRLIITLALVELERTRPARRIRCCSCSRSLRRSSGWRLSRRRGSWRGLVSGSDHPSRPEPTTGAVRQVLETFIGNAGVIQAFSNMDLATTGHLSKMLGNATLLERQDVRVSASSMDHGDLGLRETPRSVPLLEPFEIVRHFARPTWRQLILSPGRPPIYMERYRHNGTDV